MDEDKLWDDIIPEDARVQAAEENKAELGVRRSKLKTFKQDHGSSDEDDAEDDNDSESKENKDAPKWRNCSLNQTRAFLKSIKK